MPTNDQTFSDTPLTGPTENSPSAFGKYEILGEIARGGVGVVYRARQRGLDRIVALKVLQSGATVGAEHVKRFLEEAQAASKLQHPNIVPIHDFGTEDGQYFFTMDFVEGESLADRLERGPIPPREALEIVRQAAGALHYAHEHGVVHRDIKPGNILLDKAGTVKVTDFGIAKREGREETKLTVTGQVMGTPRYMSPEQATGHTAKADRRSDVFSLGVTLYEMLTGVPVFESDNVITVLQKVATEDPPLPHKVNRKIHRDISTLCMKAMEKRPDDRYDTALAFAEDIGRFLDGEPIEARPVSLTVHLSRKAVKHWKFILLNLAITGLVAYLGTRYVGYYLASRPSHVHFDLTPTNANLAVDAVGITDEAAATFLSLKPGKHLIHAELEPIYEPQIFSVETHPGERVTLPITLVRRMGRLDITTDPPDASVTIYAPNGTHSSYRGPRVEQELPTGQYGLLVFCENHLTQRRDARIESRQTQTFRFSLPAINIWNVPTAGNVHSVPAVTDIDGSGWRNVIVGDDDGRIYCLSGKNGVPLWLFNAQNAVQAPIALLDLNHDGITDVIAGSIDHRLYAIHGRTGQLLWQFETGGPIVGPTRLKDVNGDGVPDIFFGSADQNVYALSGADGQLLWKFRTGGRIESAVAWYRGPTGLALLVGSADQFLYALDPRTGELLWKLDAGAPLLFPPRIENPNRNGHLVAMFPTPKTPGDVLTHTAVALDEHRVLGVSDEFPMWLDLAGDSKPFKLLAGPRGTECYAPDGVTLLWKSEFAAVAPHGADVNSDGILDLIFSNGPDEIVCLNGKTGQPLGEIHLDVAVGRGFSLEDVDRDGVPDVTVGAGRRVYCFSWVGGRQKWRAASDGYFDAPFAVADGKLIAKNQNGLLAAYAGDNATPVWTFRTAPQPPPYTGPSVEQGIVVDADAHTRTLRALAVTNGAVLWQTTLAGNTDAPIGAPAIGNGVVIVSNGTNTLHCFNAADGVVRWTSALRRATVAPTVGKTAACVPDGDGVLRCVALSDGHELWQFKLRDATPWPASPTFLDINGDGIEDVIAVNSSGYTYALDGRTGQTLWWHQHSQTKSTARNRVVVAPGAMRGVLATEKGDVICLNLADGKPVWTVSLNESIPSEVVVTEMNADGVPEIIVGTMNRRVHCLDGRDGATLWNWEVGGPIRFCPPALLNPGTGEIAPRVVVGCGPPDNAIYCLSGDCVRTNALPWFGPWRSLSQTK